MGTRRRGAAVDAESEEAGELELEGGEKDEEDGELEEGILGGQNTFEIEAIAALARCSSFAVDPSGACAMRSPGAGR